MYMEIPVGATPADARCLPFRFRMQNKVGNRMTTASVSHLTNISSYFQAFAHSPYRWCPQCRRTHSLTTICLPQPFFNKDTVTIIISLANGDLTFASQPVSHMDVLFVITYFVFDEEYSWPFLWASLRSLDLPATLRELPDNMDAVFMLSWMFEHGMSPTPQNVLLPGSVQPLPGSRLLPSPTFRFHTPLSAVWSMSSTTISPDLSPTQHRKRQVV